MTELYGLGSYQLVGNTFFFCIMQTTAFTQVCFKTITHKLYRKNSVYVLIFVKYSRFTAAILIFHPVEVQRGALCAETCTLCRLQLVTKDDAICTAELWISFCSLVVFRFSPL